jgi:hypothetical protein
LYKQRVGEPHLLAELSDLLWGGVHGHQQGCRVASEVENDENHHRDANEDKNGMKQPF